MFPKNIAKQFPLNNLHIYLKWHTPKDLHGIHFAQENFRNRSTIARSHTFLEKNIFTIFSKSIFSSFWYPKSDILKEWESVNEILEKISIVQTMEKAHKVLEYCAAKSKDDMFQTSRVSKFFAEQTFKAIVLKISDNYSDVLSNGPLNQTCRQVWARKSEIKSFRGIFLTPWISMWTIFVYFIQINSIKFFYPFYLMENVSERIGINLKNAQTWLRAVFESMLGIWLAKIARALLADILSRLILKIIIRKSETRVKWRLNNIIRTGWSVNHRYIAHQNLLEANNRV